MKGFSARDAWLSGFRSGYPTKPHVQLRRVRLLARSILFSICYSAVYCVPRELHRHEEEKQQMDLEIENIAKDCS